MQTINTTSHLKELKGILERILYSNHENHYTVGEFLPDNASSSVTITGPLPHVQCGETLHLQGNWEQHPQHGLQFKVSTFQSKLPSSLQGIRKYLGSGLVPGVGKTYANKIVNHFKTETLTIISEESTRLQEVPGIGKTRAKAIKKAWDEQQAFREVFLFLKTYSITNAQCIRLVNKYGAETITILKTNPYQLASDFSGIGFKTADKIALNLGLPNTGPQRLQAGLLFTLQTLASEGHTAIPNDHLISTAAQLLDTPPDALPFQLEELVKDKKVVISPTGLLQIPRLQDAETKIAKAINDLLGSPSVLPPIAINKAIHWAQDRAGFEFAPEQALAVHTALSSKVSILTGGPGTGKTTILRAIVDILKAKKAKVLLAAPTGRAAQRLSQATHSFTQTLHRLLKFDTKAGDFAHNNSNPLTTDFVIIDESSMLDSALAAAIFSAIPPNAHLLLVGDTHQLPSVGPGAILNDLILSTKVPTTSLNKIFRQKNYSNIVTTAHNILQGQAAPPPPVESIQKLSKQFDLQFIQSTSPEDCMKKVTDLLKTYIPKHYPDKDAQVLAPMHKGAMGISLLNTHLQKTLNSNNNCLSFGHQIYKVDDRILQTRNNYDLNIYNGDLGIIKKIHPETLSLTVQFDNQTVDLERAHLPEITLAYAISIHKSQGSEFPIVIIPLLKSHFIMLQRNLIYTAITRGRKKVFIIGDPTAYALAVQNSKATQRSTGLQEYF